MDKIETPLGDLSRLNPKPGDVFVLETPADFKMAALDQTLMATEFEQECDGAKLLILPPGCRVVRMTPEVLKAACDAAPALFRAAMEATFPAKVVAQPPVEGVSPLAGPLTATIEGTADGKHWHPICPGMQAKWEPGPVTIPTEVLLRDDGAVERAIQSRMEEKLRDLMAADDAQREAAIIHGDPSGVKPIGVIDASGEEPYVGISDAGREIPMADACPLCEESGSLNVSPHGRFKPPLTVWNCRACGSDGFVVGGKMLARGLCPAGCDAKRESGACSRDFCRCTCPACKADCGEAT